MTASTSQISHLLDRQYTAGFITDIDADSVLPGLGAEAIRPISARKQELQLLPDWRLKSCRHRHMKKSLHSMSAFMTTGNRHVKQTTTADEQRGHPDVTLYQMLHASIAVWKRC